EGDLLAATEGRAFWILNDITPLRQLTPQVASAKVFLFIPRPSYRLAGGGRGAAPSRATIHYSLGAQLVAADTLRLEIRDTSGMVVARVASADESPAPASDAPAGHGGGRAAGGREGRGGASARLSTRPGINEFSWDLRASTGEGIVQ